MNSGLNSPPKAAIVSVSAVRAMNAGAARAGTAAAVPLSSSRREIIFKPPSVCWLRFEAIQIPCLFPADLAIADIREHKLARAFRRRPVAARARDLDLQAISLVEPRDAFRRNDFLAAVGAQDE